MSSWQSVSTHVCLILQQLLVSPKLEFNLWTMSKYLHHVLFIDSGTPALYSSTLVHVHLKDLNDNAPEFTKEYYTTKIVEEIHRIQNANSFSYVTAEDADQKGTAKVWYSLAEGEGVDDGTFGIDHRNGILYANKNLDREHKANYEVSQLRTCC